MIKIIEALKKKWNIKSNWDCFFICLTFSLAGMMIVHERRPIFHLIGITEHTPFWIKALVYVPLIVPCYQFNLIVFGTLLGQFEFFWEKEKKILRFLRTHLLRQNIQH